MGGLIDLRKKVTGIPHLTFKSGTTDEYRDNYLQESPKVLQKATLLVETGEGRNQSYHTVQSLVKERRALIVEFKNVK